ncbi:MAG: Ig-like domain-containing protein, partial [Candidatus Omnitrophota bacterium]|nr:Ig-like domain-containing protein [Candidatus Omnitrophota bacterium]
QLQEYLKKMQQSQDARELQKTAQEFKEEIKNTAQDKQEQAKMLEAVQRLKEVLDALLEKKAPTAAELKEINKINEKIKQAAEIKQQFLLSKALAEILEKIERLSLQDAKKAQALKEKLEQMRKSNAPEEVEKIILDLKNIVNSQSAQVDKDSMMEQEGKQQWKIYILSSSLIVSQGITVPLKVIAVYKNGYIKELTSDVEWFSTDPQIARVDDLNFLHPLAKGKTKIRAVYKGAASENTAVNVVDDIDAQTVQTIKQELAK